MTALPAAARCSSRGIHQYMIIVVVLLVNTVLWAGLCSCGSVSGALEQERVEEMSGGGGGGSFEMQLMYKYSQQFREVTKGRPGWEYVAAQEWPRQGTPEFYHTLAMGDRHRHASLRLRRRRNLLNDSTAADVYSLDPSNATYYAATLGAIHYTFISLGTPPKLFLVGLDTGSDLLWVPCDCQQCSVANWASYNLDLPGIDFAIYSPSNSSTSKAVACNNSDICTSTLSPSAAQCDVAQPQACTYVSNYLSANTSSSGKIVQDVVYLNRESEAADPSITADIYFGCGSVQTGDFLKGGAPNGLFGLGPDVYSVPSTLAKSGVTQNVFSMCFASPNDVGRLVFGRKPAASLQSTPLIPTEPNVYYVVGIEGIVAGGVSLNVSGAVVFDTGTSLTSLPSHVVQVVGDALASKTTLKSWAYTHPPSSTQLDYCWNATTNAELESLSSLSFTFGGGGNWTIRGPLLGFGQNDTLDFVCLGIVTSEHPIIGFNFMSNYEYFFDLGTSTFSWGPSDCSTATNTIEVAPLSAPSQSPSTSSRPPSPTSPPSKSLVSDTPQAPASIPTSKAHTWSLQHTPCQVVYLTIFTGFFHLLANRMS